MKISKRDLPKAVPVSQMRPGQIGILNTGQLVMRTQDDVQYQSQGNPLIHEIGRETETNWDVPNAYVYTVHILPDIEIELVP